MKYLECPSSPVAGQDRTNVPGTTNFYSMRNAKRANYLFATGVFTDYDSAWETKNADPRQAAFGNDGAANLAAITDGTSNTIAVGEATGGRNKTAEIYGPWGLNGAHTCCHGRVVANVANGMLAPTALQAQQWTINGVWTAGDPQRKTYAWVFNSLHSGGAQFVNCDGSTRFIGQTIDYVTFCRLNYIHDGQPIGNF